MRSARETLCIVARVGDRDPLDEPALQRRGEPVGHDDQVVELDGERRVAQLLLVGDLGDDDHGHVRAVEHVGADDQPEALTGALDQPDFTAPHGAR